MAFSWLAYRPGITAPIASATSVAQLQELLGGIELELDAEARADPRSRERLARGLGTLLQGETPARPAGARPSRV